MHFELMLPGLLPPTRKLAAGLHLPAFETMLRFARLSWDVGTSHESAVASAFGLSPDDVPVAALRRLGERDDAAVDGYWLCADPVHLHGSHDHPMLDDIGEAPLSSTEATSLLEALNAHFLPVEKGFLRFEARSARRWYLRLKTPPAVSFDSLREVVGRPVEQFLPRGEDALHWRRIIHEAQELLRNHPVNRAREAAGRRPFNGLWFWGAGTLPERAQAPASLIRSNDKLTRGLARLAGARVEALGHHLPGRNSLIVDTRLLRPAQRGDGDKWRSRLREVESIWFAPLLAALGRKQLSSLHVVAPCEQASLDIHLRPRDLLKLWRRHQRLDRILAHQG
ncbi:hypothetical protein [Pseudothauera rhizosphaerae]|uniref:Cofactor-independent phosphoglycerate mutase n=1 Tax=Pseudothauera rhizosphaerae TaxID=2565932 RepID=A0A4S4AMI0_9RHOO|nr:hypothetical protein [Pseudothauera rhizosphaerae]THF60823.1 hypothetical protein E6O51_11300 [Pseudothauera rhizosphaerae]